MPEPHAAIYDYNRNKLVDPEDWVNIGTVTYLPDKSRKLDLAVCEPATDYFRADSDPILSPLNRWQTMFKINPKLRLSRYVNDYIQREQKTWVKLYSR